MRAIKVSWLEILRASLSGTKLPTPFGKLLRWSMAALNAIAAFYEAHDAFERSLSFEERLQRTGRIRYR